MITFIIVLAIVIILGFVVFGGSKKEVVPTTSVIKVTPDVSVTVTKTAPVQSQVMPTQAPVAPVTVAKKTAAKKTVAKKVVNKTTK